MPRRYRPDSAPLVRFDFATRKLDTAAFIKIAPVRMNVVQNERGVSMSTVINPMPVVDDWAVLPDGAIALLRGKDYRLEVINADGTRAAGEKVAFDWQRLTDDDKAACSTRRAPRWRRCARTPRPCSSAAARPAARRPPRRGAVTRRA